MNSKDPPNSRRKWLEVMVFYVFFATLGVHALRWYNSPTNDHLLQKTCVSARPGVPQLAFNGECDSLPQLSPFDAIIPGVWHGGIPLLVVAAVLLVVLLIVLASTLAYLSALKKRLWAPDDKPLLPRQALVFLSVLTVSLVLPLFFLPQVPPSMLSLTAKARQECRQHQEKYLLETAISTAEAEATRAIAAQAHTTILCSTEAVKDFYAAIRRSKDCAALTCDPRKSTTSSARSGNAARVEGSTGTMIRKPTKEEEEARRAELAKNLSIANLQSRSTAYLPALPNAGNSTTLSNPNRPPPPNPPKFKKGAQPDAGSDEPKLDILAALICVSSPYLCALVVLLSEIGFVVGSREATEVADALEALYQSSLSGDLSTSTQAQALVLHKLAVKKQIAEFIDRLGSSTGLDPLSLRIYQCAVEVNAADFCTRNANPNSSLLQKNSCEDFYLRNHCPKGAPQ